MKQLISATLSEEAAEIYNSWEKQTKSKVLSSLICNEHVNYKLVEALRKQKSYHQRLISNAMIALHIKDPKHPLVNQLNEALEGTIYYQYWDLGKYKYPR
ncbi:MAG: hypothetical protein ACTSQH_08395 [Candidatus Hodarchaeales archaeon]